MINSRFSNILLLKEILIFSHVQDYTCSQFLYNTCKVSFVFIFPDPRSVTAYWSLSCFCLPGGGLSAFTHRSSHFSRSRPPADDLYLPRLSRLQPAPRCPRCSWSSAPLLHAGTLSLPATDGRWSPGSTAQSNSSSPSVCACCVDRKTGKSDSWWLWVCFRSYLLVNST